MNDLRDLIDTDDLDPGEEARLRRVHELLVQAGPPAELPPTLAVPPPERRRADVVQFPLLPRRRGTVAAAVAAALVAIAFGGGYLTGHSKSRVAAFVPARVVPMHGVQGTTGSAAQVEIAAADAVGNWPMQVEVKGLPTQAPGAYYELWLTRDGKPVATCGTFRVHGSTTTVRFTVPYALNRYDGWVVTAVPPGGPEPGRVVMTT